MSHATPQGGEPLYTDERLIMRSEAIAESWHRVLDDKQVYLLRSQILGLLRKVYGEVVDNRSTISQMVAGFNRLTDEIRQREATIAAQAAQITSLEQQLAQAISAYKEVCEVIAKEQPDATGRVEPMWDKERIAHEVLHKSKHHSETSADWGFLEVRVMGAYVCEELLHQLRDSYEVKLAQQAARIERDEAQIAMLQEMVGQQAIDATKDGWRIAELERQLAEAKGDAEYWHGMFVNGSEGRNE